MEQVYNKILADDAQIAGIPHAGPSVAIGAGKQRCVRVKFPSHGRITDLTVDQKSSDSTKVNFTVELLASKAPYTPDTDVTQGTAPTGDIELYRIIDPMTATAGNAVDLHNNATGYPYRNLDGTFSDNQRFIYVVIIPVTGQPATNWNVTITASLFAD